MRKIKELNIQVERTARFYTSGELNGETRHIWFVCHGYASLASEFIQSFRLLGKDHFVVAPEALSRFYVSGFSGKVGASWMTKESREHEIEDYLNYLKQLTTTIIEKAPNSVKTHLLGFSQGAATICRFAAADQIKTDSIIIWAGSMAGEINYADSKNFNSARVLVVYGTKDPFLKPENITSRENLLKDNFIDFETVTFPGKHAVYSQVLQEIIQSHIE